MHAENETRIAWTDRDGLGRAPAAPHRGVALGVAGAITAVFGGIMSTDALCPEHRAWVQTLAAVALIGSVVAVVGLARQWATAAVWALGSAVCGIAIGLLDAAHEPDRGRLIALGFTVVALGAAALTLQQLRLQRWAARVDRALTREIDDRVLAANDQATDRADDAASIDRAPTSTR